LFFSRQGDPEDWDFSVTDVGGAVDLGIANAGQIGDVVTSLTPHADNCLLIGCPSSMWILLGDPRTGGQLANLSKTIGVVDRNAWCTTPDGLFVFLSADGLYMIPAGCSMDGNPVSLSRERLPVELLNINPAATAAGTVVSMAYDVRWRGIHVFKTPRTPDGSGLGAVHWFFDWETKSFWEVQYKNSDFDPWTCHARPNYPSEESVVVMGCVDGALRFYSSDATHDDEGELTQKKIESYLVFGPFGDEPDLTSDVRVDEIDVSLSSDSGQVDWTLCTGDNAELAAANLTGNKEQDIGHLYGGRNPRFYPRVRGAAVFLKLSSLVAWAFEAASIVLSKLGKTRV
jgi:hypothetical protein